MPPGRTDDLLTRSVSLDTLRADHLGVYGYYRDTSPAIDEIAKESVVFMQARPQSSYTLPSHKSMLTGYYPRLLDYMSAFRNAPNKKLPAGVPLISTYLKKAGYHNVAFTNSGYVASVCGFFKDFDFYNELSNLKSQWEEGDRIVKKTGFDKAFEWLKNRRGSAPFFMFMHTYSPHAPYAAPEKYDNLFHSDLESDLPVTIAGEFLNKLTLQRNEPGFSVPRGDVEAIISAYDRGVRWTDDEIKKLYGLLQSLGLLENTILIITSDHGEEFFEHKGFGHNTMYEELLHVPLIIRYPKKFKRGTIIEKTVELIDLQPTILDLLNIKPAYPVHGKSLLPLLTGRYEQSREDQPIFASRPGWDMIRYGKYKLILRTGDKKVYYNLYNMEDDPTEKINLINNSTVESEIKDTLVRGLLYYFAQCNPGLNLIFDPGSEKMKYDILVSDIDIIKDYSYFKPSYYSFESSLINYYVNRRKMVISRFPTLLTLEGKGSGEMIRIDLSESGGGAGRDSEDALVKIGLAGDLRLPSPILLSRTSEAFRKVRFFDGFRRFIDNRYRAILWYTNYGWEWSVTEHAGSKSEELEDQLRNLGYIH